MLFKANVASVLAISGLSFTGFRDFTFLAFMCRRLATIGHNLSHQLLATLEV